MSDEMTTGRLPSEGEQVMAKTTKIRFPDGRRFELTQIPDGRWKVQNMDDKRGWSLYDSRRDAIEAAQDMGGRVE